MVRKGSFNRPGGHSFKKAARKPKTFLLSPHHRTSSAKPTCLYKYKISRGSGLKMKFVNLFKKPNSLDKYRIINMGQLKNYITVVMNHIATCVKAQSIVANSICGQLGL